MTTSLKIRPCSVDVAKRLFADAKRKAPPCPAFAIGAFAPGGLFGEGVRPVAALVAGRPGAVWRQALLEVRLIGRSMAWEGLLRSASQARDGVGPTMIAYAKVGGSLETSLRAAGWGYVEPRGGGHVGFDVVESGSGEVERKSAREVVNQLHTRSVKRLAVEKPHWKPVYADPRGLFCWPPEAGDELKRKKRKKGPAPKETALPTGGGNVAASALAGFDEMEEELVLAVLELGVEYAARGGLLGLPADERIGGVRVGHC